jgi:hypothetical protein
VPSSANLSYYLEIVQEKYLLRKMIHTCTDVVGRVYEHEGEVDSLLDEVERDILHIDERLLLTLLVPYLVPGVTRIPQDRPDRTLGPRQAGEDVALVLGVRKRNVAAVLELFSPPRNLDGCKPTR